VGGRTLAQSLALLAGKISDTTRFARAVALLALAKKSLSADFDQPLWTPICREKLGAWLEFRSPAARYHFRALSFLNVPVVPIGGASFADAWFAIWWPG